MKHLFLFFCLSCLYSVHPITATTIVPFVHLGETLRLSEVVVLAQAQQSIEFHQGELVYQDTRFRVVSGIKGPLEAGQYFDLRPFSKQIGPYYAEVAGDFEPVLGQTYLLFLYKNGAVWRPQMLSYYVFEAKDYLGQSCLMPLAGGMGTEVMARPDGIVPEPLFVYRRLALLQALRNYATGATSVWDPEPAKANLPVGSVVEGRAIPTYCDFVLGGGTVLARWKNAAIDVYYDDTGVPGGFSGTLNAILNDMTSNYTGISLFNSGQASYVPDCSDNTPATASELLPFFNNSLSGSQSILLMFDDPCNEIPPLSGCSGTLGYGGSYRFGTSSNHVYKGDTWEDCGYGYLVVNNGVPSCYVGTPLLRFIEHEMTHIYRLDHISAATHPGNNMNPSCCNPIFNADRACMNYTYDAVLLPVALRDFSAKALGQQVLLSWKTESEHNNRSFLLERSADGLRFQVLADVAAGNKASGGLYEWLDKNPLPGLGYYRLTQIDFDGKPTQLGLRSVQMEDLGARFSLAPNPVSSEMDGLLLLQSAQPWEGTIDLIGVEGTVHYSESVSVEAGTHRLALPVKQLPSGVYRVSLRDKTGVKTLNLSKL